jgi:hypothetical protein
MYEFVMVRHMGTDKYRSANATKESFARTGGECGAAGLGKKDKDCAWFI